MSVETSPHVQFLTFREREVAWAVSRGLRNRAIAQDFGISEETVKKHLASIYGKLALDGRVQLAIHVLRAETPYGRSVPASGQGHITRTR